MEVENHNSQSYQSELITRLETEAEQTRCESKPDASTPVTAISHTAHMFLPELVETGSARA